MLKTQEKKRVVHGMIKVHYMGPDDPDYAPYYLHSGNECKKVGESGLYHEEHEVIFYDKCVILTVYEARFHLFGISDGWVISGPYTKNLKFRKEHSYWQIKKESLYSFYKNDLDSIKRLSLLSISGSAMRVGNLISYLKRYKENAKKLNHNYVLHQESLVKRINDFCIAKQKLEEYAAKNIADYNSFMEKFHKMCELYYLAGLNIRNDKKSNKLVLDAEVLFTELSRELGVEK